MLRGSHFAHGPIASAIVTIARQAHGQARLDLPTPLTLPQTHQAITRGEGPMIQR